MTCEHLKIGDAHVIVCGRGRRTPRCFRHRDRPSQFQCDARLKGSGKTCDRHLCWECANEVAPGKHLCPGHNEQWQARQQRA